MNPRLDAVVSPDFGAVGRHPRLALPDGPFRGVQYLIKDLHAPVAGLPLSHGRRLFAGSVFPFYDGFAPPASVSPGAPMRRNLA
jgi:amidase